MPPAPPLLLLPGEAVPVRKCRAAPPRRRARQARMLPPHAWPALQQEREDAELQVLRQVLASQSLAAAAEGLGDGRWQRAQPPQAPQQQQHLPAQEATGFVCGESELCGLDHAAAAAAAASLDPPALEAASRAAEAGPAKAAGGKQRVPCPQCQRTFRYPNELAKHVEMAHEGLKFACPHCGKAYSTRCNLQKHVAGSHEGKSYPCTECSKVYTDPSNLRKHVRTAHNKGMRVACPLCDKTFTQATHMRQHLRSAHEGVRFLCAFPGCERQYTRNDQLAAHVRLVHGESAPLEAQQPTSFESADMLQWAATAEALSEVPLWEDHEFGQGGEEEEADDDDETHVLAMQEEDGHN